VTRYCTNIPDPHHRETSLTHLLRCIKANHHERWENKWNSIPLDLKRHSHVGDWKQRPDRLFLDNRIICSTVTQMRTEHGHFASYLNRMEFRDDDRCTSCPPGLRETPQHLLFHCPHYSKARLIAAKKSRIPLHTKAFLYRDIAYEALAELIRDTRLSTRTERATKEAEREGHREVEGGELGVDEDDLEEDDEEEWEKDEELVGRETVEPVLPEETLEAVGRWLYDAFRNV
jgi:predicted RNA-binding Zn-ribbon protein involved in translation (DUF1610 family)